MARKPKKPPKDEDPPLPPPPAVPAELLPLDEDEERFVAEYAIDRIPGAAYRRAFPGTGSAVARVRARELMARPNVAAEIRAQRAEQTRRCRLEADLVLNEICAIAFSDIYSLYDPATGLLRMPRHIPLQTRKAIASVKISRERRYTVVGRKSTTTITDTVIEYKLWPKLDALEKLCRYLGLNTELPPLDVLLNALPKQMAEQVRASLIAQSSPPPSIAPAVPVQVTETPTPPGTKP